MKKLELTKDELEKLYHLPPKDVEKETEFQITYRMGRNSLVLELIKKIDEELTPHIEYWPNGNVWIKGQKNSKGQREGIWEWFCPNGNIKRRVPYKEGKIDGIVEWFNEQGNITQTRLWKDGKLIEETKPELTPLIEYYSNGNVWIKGQKNSKGQEEGIWEWFYEDGNIRIRTPHKEGKIDGIVECFDEQGNIIKTYVWKDGKLIEETKPELQPDPQLIDSMAMRYKHDFGFLDEKHKESIRTTMKQLWEEVVGLGFYKPKSK
jgi:antitoxin component YwqK of YwqJK toxin-antitoxin module